MTTILGNIPSKKIIDTEVGKKTDIENIVYKDIYLTGEERLKIQLLLEKINNIESGTNLLAMRIQSLNLMNQNLDLRKTQITNDIKLVTKQIEEKKIEHKNINGEYNTLLEVIVKKYNLKKNWEFDNDTGKVIKNED
jgi:hypothetical protein